MAVTKDKPAPYAPPKAVLEIVERYRHRGLPAPIDTEVLGRAGISPSLTPRTLYALQVLNLIDEDGKPTETFEGIRLAPEAEYKDRLANWLKAAYSDIFSFVDPTTDDETAIRDAFRSYNPVGQQDRMVTLFIGLCTAAGLMPEKASTPKASKPRPAPPRPMRSVASPAKPKQFYDGGGPSGLNAPAMGLPAPLAGLLSSLPSNGSWTKAKRDQFMTTFGAVLDFCFPLVEQEEVVTENEDGGT